MVSESRRSRGANKHTPPSASGPCLLQPGGKDCWLLLGCSMGVKGCEVTIVVTTDDDASSEEVVTTMVEVCGGLRGLRTNALLPSPSLVPEAPESRTLLSAPRLLFSRRFKIQKANTHKKNNPSRPPIIAPVLADDDRPLDGLDSRSEVKFITILGKEVGVIEGVTIMEGVLEGETEMDGVIEGVAELEGVLEGVAELEGVLEGVAELEGVLEGVAELEGVPEDVAELEEVTEGVVVGEEVPEGVYPSD